MAAEVSDELLDHFVVTGPRSELADKILERYQGLATKSSATSGASTGRKIHRRCTRGPTSPEAS